MADTPRDPQETEVNAVTFHSADLTRSVEFYRSIGFELVYGGAGEPFASLRVATVDEPADQRRGAANFVNLQFVEGFTQPGGAWGRVVFHVSDPDDVFERLRQGGVSVEFPPRNAPWGERYFHLRDPDGHELSFARLLRSDEAPDPH